MLLLGLVKFCQKRILLQNAQFSWTIIFRIYFDVSNEVFKLNFCNLDKRQHYSNFWDQLSNLESLVHELQNLPSGG